MAPRPPGAETLWRCQILRKWVCSLSLSLSPASHHYNMKLMMIVCWKYIKNRFIRPCYHYCTRKQCPAGNSCGFLHDDTIYETYQMLLRKEREHQYAYQKLEKQQQQQQPSHSQQQQPQQHRQQQQMMADVLTSASRIPSAGAVNAVSPTSPRRGIDRLPSMSPQPPSPPTLSLTHI